MAVVQTAQSFDIHTEEDIVRIRQTTRQWAQSAGLGLVDQTKVVTAASELARNMVLYAGGGEATIEAVAENGRSGLRLRFEDRGPGIPDLERAMTDGYTTGTGLGLGLGGAKRLSSEFSIRSEAGKGTTIVITRWKA